MQRKSIVTLFLCLVLSALAYAQEKVDLNMIHRIKTEEFQDSQVMDVMYNLTDRYGPRLVNSPQFRAAGDWAVRQLNEWGLDKVHLEKWAAAAIPGWETPITTGR